MTASEIDYREIWSIVTIQSYLNVSSIQEHVLYRKQTADRLFGDQYHWSCLAAGSKQIQTSSLFVAVAIAISLVILRACTIDVKAMIRKIEAHSLAENNI